MKKRILLGILLTLALTCLLAFSISAEEIDGVHYTLDTKNQTAQVSTGNRTATTEIVTIPSTVEYNGVEYRVTSIANDAFWGNKNMVELRILSEYITKIPASMIADTYSTGTLKKIYIDFSKITSIGSAAFNPSNQTNGNSPQANSFYYYDAKAFLENGEDVLITCPDFSSCTSIGAAAFQGANFEKVVVPAGCSISNQVFRKSTIKEAVILGSERTKIEYYVFDVCKSLETIRIESPIQSYSNNVFSGCTAVKSIYIDMSHVTYVGGNAFTFSTGYDKGNTTTQWYNLDGEKIVDLTNLTDFGNTSYGTFSSSNIGSAKIIWPKALNSFPNQTFRMCNITCPVYINMAEGKTATVEYYAFDGNSPSIIVLGNGVTAYNPKINNTTVIFTEENVTLGKDAKNASATYYYKSASEALTGDKYVQITDSSAATYKACGLVATVTLTDGAKQEFNYVTHDYKGVADETVCPSGSLTLYTCAGCDDKYEETTESFVSKLHNFDLENGAEVLSILFADDNYFADGKIIVKCAGCTEQNDEESFPALFSKKGYSASETDKTTISYTIYVNNEAIKEYEAYGNTVRYGLVVSALPNGAPIWLDEDGSIKSGDKTIFIEMQNAESNYSILTAKLFNLKEDQELHCSAYAITGNDIVYLNHDSANKIAETVTHALIVEKLKNEEE